MSNVTPRSTPVPEPATAKPWSTPKVTELPKLTSLTLASLIGGGGGTGGGGSTVFTLLLAAGLALGLSACAQDSMIPTDGGRRPPLSTVAKLDCRADLAARTVDCSGPNTAAGQAIVGGQGTRVGLRSSNVSYNGTSHVFSADVTVQNESSLPMGTTDGATKDSAGIKVFFTSGPTGDVGTVTVANATGTGTFTSSNQPYFKYDTLLASQKVTGAQTWQFQLDPATTSFTFSVLVAAVMPATGAISRWVAMPGVNPISWQAVSGWGLVGVAAFGQNGEVFVQDSGVWHAYNDPHGVGPSGPAVAGGRNDLTLFDGSAIRFRHWDGISWRSIDSLPNSPGLMYKLAPTGGLGGAWAFGFRIARFDGKAWISDSLPTGVNKAVAATTLGTDPLILTDQGRVWRQSTSTGAWTQIGGSGGSGQTQGPGIIFASGATSIWTISTVNNTDPIVRYWDGTSWTTQAVPTANDNGVPSAGFANSASDAWMIKTDNVGHGHLWHWDGSNWSETRTDSWAYNDLWSRSSNDFFMAEGGGRLEENIGGTWTTALGATAVVTAGWMHTANDLYLGTAVGQILHSNGTTWDTAASVGGQIQALWGAGTSDLWFVQNAFTLYRDSLGTVYAPSVPGVGGFGIAGVGGSGTHDVWAVGGIGGIYHYDGSQWTNPVAVGDITFSDLKAVWAADPNFAVAVGLSGTILQWGGSSWVLATSPTGVALRAVSGTSDSDVWAVGDGGTVVHYDGTSWTTGSSGVGQNLTAVWASSSSEVYAVGDNGTVIMWNGTAWSPVAVESSAGASYTAVSGVPGGQALIAGGRVFRGVR